MSAGDPPRRRKFRLDKLIRPRYVGTRSWPRDNHHRRRRAREELDPDPLLIILLSCAQAAAQRRFDEPLPPKTELEALQLQYGAVIVRGSQRVGGVRAQGTGRIDVSAFEVIDTGSGRRARGVAVEVEEGGERGREVTAFIDYEELDGLIKGLESVGKVDRGETQLPGFEVSFRTKGDLVVSVFSSRGGIARCVVSAGEFSAARVPIPLDELANLRTLIGTAKNRLDDARAR